MAKTPTPAPAPTPEPPSNTHLWDTLGKTDPRHTKPIVGKPFKGTAIKPMWINRRLTEVFGPCGTGWGTGRPEFEVVRGDGGEVLVYCTVAGWYLIPGSESSETGTVYGVGGDFIVKKQKGALFHDDEGYKKAYTDAIGNAFKFVGVAADIHMGLFDDSKYVQDVGQEFLAAEDTLGIEVDALQDQIRGCDDLKILTTELLPVVKTKLEELKAADRKGEATMLTSVYNARKAKLSPPPVDQPEDTPDGA